MKHEIAYVQRQYKDMTLTSYKPLRPTGKWKIEYKKGSEVLYIEHHAKDAIFKEWISEENIVFKPKGLL